MPMHDDVLTRRFLAASQEGVDSRPLPRLDGTECGIRAVWVMRMRRLGTVLAASLLAATACTVGTSSPPPERTVHGASAEAVELINLPRDDMEACEKVLCLRAACPMKVPSSSAEDLRTNSFKQGRHWTFTTEGGSGPYESPRRNRPPGFIHVVVQGGDLSDAFETFTYSESRIVSAADGVMRSAERRRLGALGQSGETPMGLFFGERRWSGRHGDLILAPPFTYTDSIHADHLIFLWRSDGTAYAVSLHAWEPFTEAVATLRAVVSSVRSQRRRDDSAGFVVVSDTRPSQRLGPPYGTGSFAAASSSARSWYG
jgi:hypothetical protein